MMGRSERRKLGVTDWFLLFLLLLSAVGGLLRRQERRQASDAIETAEYRLLLLSEVIDRTAADCLAEGETLYDAAGQAVGRVSRLQIRAAEIRREAEGKTVTGEWPMEVKCRLLVQIVATGALRDGVFLLNGRIPLPVGSYETLFSQRMRLHGEVVGVLEFAPENLHFDENVGNLYEK